MMEEGLIEHAESILAILDDKEKFKKHLDKTREAKKRLEWFRKGYAQLALARQCIDNYRTTEAIEILKALVDEYEETLLADKAAALLKTFGQ